MTGLLLRNKGKAKKKWSRVLAGIGDVILIVTAVFHGMGFMGAESILAKSSIDPEWASVLSGLWIFVSWHWLVIAAPPVWFAIRKNSNGHFMLFFRGIVAFGDFWWLLMLAGFFARTLFCCLLLSACWPAAGWLSANAQKIKRKNHCPV